MKSKKPPVFLFSIVFSEAGSLNLNWQAGDILEWTGSRLLFKGKDLEESERLKNGIYADSGLEESAKYQDALNKASYQKQDQDIEQECNHEGMPKFFSPAFGTYVGACGRCADYVKEEDGKWIPIIPREQLKPSEWIKGRAKALCIEAEHYVANWTDYLGIATRDFLDEHSDLFNK